MVSDEETDLFGVHVYDVLARIAPEARSAVQSSPGFQKKGGWVRVFDFLVRV